MKYYKTFLPSLNELYEVNSCDDDYPLELHGTLELFGKQFPFERYWIGPDEYIYLLAEITKNNDNIVKDRAMAEKLMRQLSKTNLDLSGNGPVIGNNGLIL